MDFLRRLPSSRFCSNICIFCYEIVIPCLETGVGAQDIIEVQGTQIGNARIFDPTAGVSPAVRVPVSILIVSEQSSLA